MHGLCFMFSPFTVSSDLSKAIHLLVPFCAWQASLLGRCRSACFRSASGSKLSGKSMSLDNGRVMSSSVERGLPHKPSSEAVTKTFSLVLSTLHTSRPELKRLATVRHELVVKTQSCMQVMRTDCYSNSFGTWMTLL